MKTDEVITNLKSMAKPGWKENSMSRFAIPTERALGIPVPEIRKLAKEIGKDHTLALELWESGIHEASILATIIDDPKQVTEKQMESWVNDFYSWDVCDQACGNLFDKTPFALAKISEWSSRKEEFVKRAAFALLAYTAVHDKKAPDEVFINFLPLIKRESTDDRNFVKKAVNWSLREIGKRNATLRKQAIKTAQEIKQIDSKSARWIAADALRELSKKVV